MPSTHRVTLKPSEMSAFSVLPFHDEHSFETPFPPYRRRTPSTPNIDSLAMEIERLHTLFTHELGMVGGITPRKDIFEVDLDVQGYKPEDLNITVQDNALTICGMHEEKDEGGMHYQARHFTRKFVLPDNVEKDKMKSCLLKIGRFWCLKVEAPLKQTVDLESRYEVKKKTQEIPLTINYK